MAVKCNFIGRLGADAEVVTSVQTPFISFRAATTERVNREDKTVWVTVNADNTRYQKMVPYLKKGSVVYVAGTEYVSLYTSKGGQVGIDRKVNADCIEFVNLGKKDDSSHANGNSQQEAAHTATPSQNDAKNMEMTTGGLRNTAEPTPAPTYTPQSSTDNDDELPF